MSASSTRNASLRRTRDRALATVAILGAAAIAVWLISPIAHILLLAFAGVLLAIFLRAVAAPVARRVHVRLAWAVGAVCVAFAALGAAGVWLIAPQVSTQVDELGRTLPRAASNLVDEMERFDWGRALVERMRNVKEEVGGTEALTRAGGVAGAAFGAFASLLVFVFVGLFVAFDGRRYRRGMLLLVPRKHRARARSVTSRIAHVLRMWMVGKLMSMAIVGVLTYGGLLVLGVPLALTLALLAALLTFIPNFGPVLSVVPAALLGLLDSPAKALYVVLLYVAIQTIESYVLTPLIQKKTIALPPALIIVAQVAMGVLAGGLGVVIATPLTAAVYVAVKALYIGSEERVREAKPEKETAGRGAGAPKRAEAAG